MKSKETNLIFLLDSKGNCIATNKGPINEETLNFMRVFKETTTGKKLSFSEITENNTELELIIALPINGEDNKDLSGVIGVKFPHNVLNNIISRISLKPYNQVFISNYNNISVSGQEKLFYSSLPDLTSETENTREFSVYFFKHLPVEEMKEVVTDNLKPFDLDIKTYLFIAGTSIGAMSRLPGQDWLIGISNPTAQVLDRGSEQIWISFLIAGITAIIIIVISSFIRDSFCKPIEKLLNAVGQIRKGNLDTSVNIDTKEEFGSLADTFNQMIRELRYSKEELERANFDLKKTSEELEKSNLHLLKTQEIAIQGLSKLAESRDPETGAHIKRIQYYAKLLAIEIRNQGKYKDKIDDKFINNIYISSALHDVGKVGIPDSVLLKPGKLDPEERIIIESHSIIGGNALEETEEILKKESNGEASFLTMGKEIAYYHHERWDGKGYPYKLKAEEIPLAARIVALADVYDALTSDRVYRKKMSHEEAKTIILEGRGTQFDDDVVYAFLNVEDRFIAIKDQFRDLGEAV